MQFQIDEERTKRTIAHVLEKIKTDVDPLLLDEYYNIFKKEVSLFNRNKVAAYLLMQCEQGRSGRYTQRNFQGQYRQKPERRPAGNGEIDGNRSEGYRNDGNRSEGQRYPLADEESIKLFFSVGRSRRVYPREILGIINMKTAIPKEDIGAIRILENYSFVQVRDTVAEKIIEALNGMIFRGRPLTVNYAKKNNAEEKETLPEDDSQYNDEELPADEDEISEQEDLDESQDDSQEEDI